VTPSTGTASSLALLLILLTVGYLFLCWVWPFTACRHCHGAGKQRSPFGRALRICRRCNGTGLRLRPARRLWNLLRHSRRPDHPRTGQPGPGRRDGVR
jgi:hypothetical protein